MQKAAAVKLRAAVSAPIQIFINSAGEKDPGPWQVSPDFVGGMISIIRADDGDGKAHYEVQANIEPLRNFLKGLAPQLTVEPVAARFLFNESSKELQLISESVDGRSLNIDTTMKLVQDAIFKPNDRRVGLVFQKDIPKVNSKSKAAELGITEQIVQATTFFYGSTAESAHEYPGGRIQVSRAGDRARRRILVQ